MQDQPEETHAADGPPLMVGLRPMVLEQALKV